MKSYDEKLAICFHPFLILGENDDFDGILAEIAERGFNAIRFEDGAGLLWDENGNVRDNVLISQPFGKYTKYTSYRTIANGKRINLLDRLLRICRAAKKHGIKVILSSWFYLHTNWFCEEELAKPLFDITDEEKLTFFADELGRILDVLRKEGLIDNVAFAEIFNEFDGFPFVSEYRGVNDELADRFRVLHERAFCRVSSFSPLLTAAQWCSAK